MPERHLPGWTRNPLAIVAVIALVFLGTTLVVAAFERMGRDQVVASGEEGEEEEGEEGATAVAPSASVAPEVTGAPAATFTFEDDPAGSLPRAFVSARTGPGPDGTWIVRADPGAPSGSQVLAQASTDATSGRFPMAVSRQGQYGDLALSVKFKAISGRVDQAGGLVFRYRDNNNYYLVRANALENNVRLYHIIDGRRTQIAGSNLKVSPKVWHTLKVVARGAAIEVAFDGETVIEKRDDMLVGPGLVGVWTKADSVTFFDDLEVRPAD